MSFKIEHPRRWLWSCLGLSGLALWALYLATLSPAFPPDDSPETIAAAFTLGLQHPPGYPLMALLGRAAILAWPLGSVAWRVNCLSAALACVASVLAGLLAWRLTPRQDADLRLGAAVLASLGLGLCAAIWDQATAAKGGIYLLNLALGLGAWHAVLSRKPALFGLLAGLMLANHYPSAVLWLLPLGLALGARSWKPLIWALPGLSLYLYLPLRARLHPLINWGAPETWRQFWWMLGRGGYTQAADGEPSIIAYEQSSLWWQSLHQAGWVMVPLMAVAGLVLLWRRDRQWAWPFAAAAGLALLAALWINKTPADNRWLALIFALPATALLAPLAGVGLAGLAEGLQSPRLAWVALVLGMGLWAASARFPWSDRSGSYVAWDYARDLALGQPRGSLYLGEGDYHVLPLLYRQAVDHARLDVTVALNVLCGEAWYQQLLLQRDPALKLPPPGPAAAATQGLVALNAGQRAVMAGPFSELIPGGVLHPSGLARRYRADLSKAHESPPDVAAAWAARRPARNADQLEPVEANLLPWYTVVLVQMGNEAMASGRHADAILAYRRALGRPGMKPEGPLNFNLGLAYEQAGQRDKAIAAYRVALGAQATAPAATQRLQALRALP